MTKNAALPGARKSKGLTLIEFMIVVILLAIVAVTALPKFTYLTKEAQLAATRAIAGGLTDAVNIAHAKWSSEQKGSTPLTLSDGTQIQPSETGWPEAAACPTCSAPEAPSGKVTAVKCQSIIANILQNPPPIKGAVINASCPVPNTTTCPTTCLEGVNYLTAEGSGSVCSYTDVNANVIRYNINTGSVTGP